MASPLTQEFQVGIGALVLGHGSTNDEVSIVKVSGLGPQVASQTAQRTLTGGALVGVDVNASMNVEVDLEIFCVGDPDAAGQWWVDLSDAFDAVSSGTESLYIWLPGIGHRELVGRPRGLSDDGFESLPYGLIYVTARFEAIAGLGTEIV